MSRLTDLIAKTKAKDPQLGADLDREFKVLSARLPFGLNFERHSPEVVELPLCPIRKGDKVRVLPERSSKEKGDQRLWLVKAIHNKADRRIADLELLGFKEMETQSVSITDLVSVAEFRDTIYPGLITTGKVMRGKDKPCHTVINGENYHVLKALTFTHRGKIDAIYIDPPYNSGAKDWKYNNDYVEEDDQYRHSKWLAMMERRLLIAKDLLKPVDSVLIVTIDEKEYLRLGLLLEQTFPEAKIQMVSSVINPFGVARAGQFSRVEEYIYILNFGLSVPSQTIIQTLKVGELRKGDDTDEESEDDNSNNEKTTYWFSFMRAGSNSSRSHSPGCFYPIFIKTDNGEIHSIGRPIAKDERKELVTAPSGTYAAWPVNEVGEEAVWQASEENASKLLEAGYLRSGRFNKKLGRHSITYLREGTVQAIEQGYIKFDNGILTRLVEQTRKYVGKSTWNIRSHNATSQGTKLLNRFLPRRKFPYPKSLYAVEDTLRFFVYDKKDAIVLDFFSGSGTTAHAVMRLNRQDGGSRQCISVTNNEVAAEEQKIFREQGLRPGDIEWEKHGICDYITKPRIAAAITGRTPAGDLIKGDYQFTDEFPMSEGFEENAEFFTLTYETPILISHNRAFERIAALLWMRAGSFGNRIDTLPVNGWAICDAYGLLVDIDAATPFTNEVNKAEGLRVAYIVTDDNHSFQAIARRLPKSVEPVRLYESYLTNFSFTNGE